MIDAEKLTTFKAILIATIWAILLSLSLNGCVSLPPADKPGETGFWSQHVVMTAWGLQFISPYGSAIMGYVSWNRGGVLTPAPPPSPPVQQPVQGPDK